MKSKVNFCENLNTMYRSNIKEKSFIKDIVNLTEIWIKELYIRSETIKIYFF